MSIELAMRTNESQVQAARPQLKEPGLYHVLMHNDDYTLMEFVTVEHLLIALLENSAATEVLKACGANISRLRNNLLEFIDRTTPSIPSHVHDRDTQPTLGFQRVLQRAVFHVQSSGRTEVTGANVLAAIFSEQESQSVYLIRQESVSRLDVINYISHGSTKPRGGS